MRVLLEKAIVHLLNGDQDKAAALFHKFMVERARQIHESLRQNEDVQLNEGWDSEIQEEEYFDNLDQDENADGDDTEMAGGADTAPDMGGDAGGDVGADADTGLEAGDGDLESGEGDLEAGEGDLAAGEGDIGDKLDNVADKLDDLSAVFDRLMSKLGDEDDLGADDPFGDVDADADTDSDSDSDLDLSDTGAMGSGDEGETDMGAESPDKTGDLADRMEDDMTDDEHQPEHEMAENIEDDDEMMEDITESVLAELDRVTLPSNTDGKEIGSGGKTVSGNRADFLPHHDVKDRVNQAKPYLVKGGDNDSFERETPPSNKKVKDRRNNDAGVKKLTKVPAKGDAGAVLNSDFAAGRASSKPTTDGSKKVY